MTIKLSIKYKVFCLRFVVNSQYYVLEPPFILLSHVTMFHLVC